jgi:ubiquinone/menaquinone biosynthesis C-methylase UbiE
VSVDHYAMAAAGWATGAELVYRPIASELVAMSPHPLRGRRVLDVGAGTGAATPALLRRGARPVSVDLSHHMLSWGAAARPPATVGDITRLPIRDEAVDDVVAAFVLNHLTDPAAGLAEAIRVTRPGGGLLACVYSSAANNTVRDSLDDAARAEGWEPPQWYDEVKRSAVPLLASAEKMTAVAQQAGLRELAIDERAVDVGVTTATQLVNYRLGQAHFTPWLDRLGPDRAAETRIRLAAAIAAVMTPFQPIVVFLAALIPSY